jgi:hypothetical protein
MTRHDKVEKKARNSSVLVLLMHAKQSLVRLYGKRYPACAVSVAPRMRTTVLARWMSWGRMYPRFLYIESLDLLLREVVKGNRRVNERCRLSSAFV